MYISVYAGLFTFVLALGQIARSMRRATNLVTAFLMVGMGLSFIIVGMGVESVLNHFPYLHMINVPFYFLIGPLIRSYFLGVIHENKSTGSPGEILVFPGYPALIPFIVSVLIILPYVFFPVEWKRTVILHPNTNDLTYLYYNILTVNVYVGMILLVYYIARLLIRLKVLEYLFKKDSDPVVWHIRFILLWLFIWILAGFPVQYLDLTLMKRYIIAAIAIIPFWLYILDHMYPGFFHRVDREIRNREKYARSRLEGLDVSAIVLKLEQLMEEEKLFVDEDVSLDQIATHIGISSTQLSEILNSVMGIDFRNFINRYRVEEAKRLLMEHPDRSILHIAGAAGFNSKATFNRNFKVATGITPMEYRIKLHATEDRRMG